jgi:hypothetical protein
MDAGIWGIIGVVIGAASSIVTTVMVARNDSRERSKEFQRNNLIKLQTSLTELMRLTARACHKDDVDQESMIANENLSIITQRIADQSLRESVHSLHNKIGDVVLLETEGLNNEKFISAATLFNKVMLSVGVALRSLY